VLSLARRFALLARLVPTVALVILLVRFVDARAVGARLVHLDARWIAAYLALSLPLYLLYAWRWHFTAARVGAPVAFSRAYRDYYLSTLLNQVLPLGVAGDVVRAARNGGRAVVLERLSGFVALALFVVASALVWLARGRDSFLLPGAGVMLLAVGAVLLFVRLASRDRVALLARGALGFQLAVSLISVAILLAMFACAGRAAGASLDLVTVVQVVPLVLACTTVPWAFAGWGVREVSMGALYHLLGLDAALGVAVSITFGVLSLVAAAPGLVVLALPERSQRS
jgi:uncharacterized membrane protein YbhN (UPF0104 family)